MKFAIIAFVFAFAFGAPAAYACGMSKGKNSSTTADATDRAPGADQVPAVPLAPV